MDIGVLATVLLAIAGIVVTIWLSRRERRGSVTELKIPDDQLDALRRIQAVGGEMRWESEFRQVSVSQIHGYHGWKVGGQLLPAKDAKVVRKAMDPENQWFFDALPQLQTHGLIANDGKTVTITESGWEHLRATKSQKLKNARPSLRFLP